MDALLYTFKKDNAWRQHQESFIARRKKKNIFRKAIKLATVSALVCALVMGSLSLLYRDKAPGSTTRHQPVESLGSQHGQPAPSFPCLRCAILWTR